MTRRQWGNSNQTVSSSKHLSSVYLINSALAQSERREINNVMQSSHLFTIKLAKRALAVPVSHRWALCVIDTAVLPRNG